MSVPLFAPGENTLARRVVERLRFFGGVGGRDHTSLNAPNGFAFVTAKNNNHVTSNAYYDGTNWWRYDEALPATALIVTYPGQVLFYTAPLGTGPITWTASTLAAGADSGWIAVGNYGANWGPYGGGVVPFVPYYRKLPNGMVIFRGLVAKSVALIANDPMFTMPAGFRCDPNAQLIFHCPNAANNVTDIRVAATGQVLIGAGGSNLWMSLATLAYPAES